MHHPTQPTTIVQQNQQPNNPTEHQTQHPTQSTTNLPNQPTTQHPTTQQKTSNIQHPNIITIKYPSSHFFWYNLASFQNSLQQNPPYFVPLNPPNKPPVWRKKYITACSILYHSPYQTLRFGSTKGHLFGRGEIDSTMDQGIGRDVPRSQRGPPMGNPSKTPYIVGIYGL